MNQKASRMVIRGVLCAAGVAAVERDEDPIRSSMYSTMDTTTKAPSVQIHTMGDRGLRNCRYPRGYCATTQSPGEIKTREVCLTLTKKLDCHLLTQAR